MDDESLREALADLEKKMAPVEEKSQRISVQLIGR